MPIERRKILYLAFGVVPSPTFVSVAVTNTLRTLGRHFVVDALTVKSEELSHVERYQRARMLRVPLGDASFAERIEVLRRAVTRQLESDDYEIVHFRGVLEGAPAMSRAKELGYLTIMEISHFGALEVSERADELGVHDSYCVALRAEEEECIRNADLVVACSRVVRDSLRQRGRRERVQHLPHGVNVDRFDWDNPVSSDVPVVLYVGSLRPQESLRVLVNAAAEVLRYRKARFVLVGPGTREQVTLVRNHAAERGIDDRVEVRRAVPHEVLPDLYAQASVCVVPHTHQTVHPSHGPPPMNVLEALACRRPVVGCRVPQIEEVISDGHDGLLVAPGDVEELAAGIEQLLGDRTLADRLAETGYRKVRDSFTASATRRRLGEVYRKLLGGKLVRGDALDYSDPIELIASGHTTSLTGGALGPGSGFEPTPVGLDGPTTIHPHPLGDSEEGTNEYAAPAPDTPGKQKVEGKRRDTLPELELPEYEAKKAAEAAEGAKAASPRAELASDRLLESSRAEAGERLERPTPAVDVAPRLSPDEAGGAVPAGEAPGSEVTDENDLGAGKGVRLTPPRRPTQELDLDDAEELTSDARPLVTDTQRLATDGLQRALGPPVATPGAVVPPQALAPAPAPAPLPPPLPPPSATLRVDETPAGETQARVRPPPRGEGDATEANKPKRDTREEERLEDADTGEHRAG